MAPHERSRPLDKAGPVRTDRGESSTFTTLPGMLIEAEIDARELGRFLELDPRERSQAQARRAFVLASTIREVRGQVFR